MKMSWTSVKRARPFFFLSLSLSLAGSMDNKNPYFDSRIKKNLARSQLSFFSLANDKLCLVSWRCGGQSNLSPLGQVPQLLRYAKRGCLVLFWQVPRSCFYSSRCCFARFSPYHSSDCNQFRRWRLSFSQKAENSFRFSLVFEWLVLIEGKRSVADKEKPSDNSFFCDRNETVTACLSSQTRVQPQTRVRCPTVDRRFRVSN